MNNADVVVIGSGMVGSAITHRLAHAGLSVTVVEKGPEYPFPHAIQYAEQVIALYDNPSYYLPDDLKRLTRTGDYGGTLERERFMMVGGTGTRWSATTPRMIPADFKIRSLFGVGLDWPIEYDTLEPYYCKAENYLGVAGQVDNSFAGPRSEPYPLPPFALSYGDLILQDRLQSAGIRLHTTPQARTRTPYVDRPACQNYGICRFCPIGARYSPNYHLREAMTTGAVTLMTNTSVRRILVDAVGNAVGVLCQRNEDASPFELGARVVVVAASAIETARLLLLSTSSACPTGIGNVSGRVGRNLTFHSEWTGLLELEEPLFTGRVGASTAQTAQFLLPETRGNHGGALVSFHNSGQVNRLAGRFGLARARTGDEVVDRMRAMPNMQPFTILAESIPDEGKYVTLSSEVDRFGDPFAHVHYVANDFDHETFLYAQSLFRRLERATYARSSKMDGQERYGSGAHHMGTCSMGDHPATSVVDSFGVVHGSDNILLAGGSIFPGGNGAVNPTLTMVALGIRTAEFVLDQR
jgi:choline dehydrogenase-like flavoprotein